MAPGPLKKREKRVFVTFFIFAKTPFSCPSDLFGLFYKKSIIAVIVITAIKEKKKTPPSPEGARGGTPHSGRSPELNQPLKS